MAGLRAIFVGDGSLLIRCAELFTRAHNAVVGIITANERIADWARGAGIPVFGWPEGAAPDAPALDFDYLFSVANLRVIPRELLARAKRGAINFHDSLLPAYAGLNATSWAIMAGETRHGITWHEMTGDIDGGRIFRQQPFPLTPDDTAFTVNAKCYEAAAASFALLIDDLQSGRIAANEQQGTRSYFGRKDRPEAAATIDLTKSAAQITALVRALDFGAYPNPLGRAKLLLGDEVMLVRAVEVVAPKPSGPAGRIATAAADRIVVSCADADIALSGLTAADGSPLRDGPHGSGATVGDYVKPLDASLRARITERDRKAAVFERRWSREFERLAPVVLPYPRLHRASDETRCLSIGLARPAGLEPLVSGFIGWVAQLTGAEKVSLLYADAQLADAVQGLEPWFTPAVPLTVDTTRGSSIAAFAEGVAKAIQDVRRAGPYSRDLPLRVAESETVRKALAELRIGIDGAGISRRGGFDACDLVLAVDPAGGGVRLAFPRGEFAAFVCRTMARHIEFFLGEFAGAGSRALGDVPLLPPEERAAIESWNERTASLSDAAGVAHEVARQVRRTPDREAIRWGEQALDYAALDARVGLFADGLLASGAGPGTIVGIHLERTPDLIAAVLATLAIGAAYLPLDPAYPAERLRFTVEDSGAPVILTSRALAGRLASGAAKLVLVDDAAAAASTGETLHLERASASPDDLAYVIYTSGSTGRPKGVMVTHRNVLNFFAGMDARVPHADGGRWLAVTSLSFDISVLELLWTLARGFTVVLHSNVRGASARRGPDFSLFYFSSDEGADGADKYRLLLEGAKFADREGFAAVWTPERHFHAFGGLYPNSAITSAAIAAITRRVAIRAGSCVLPLHSPIRAAEDWALVDNLSNGRAGISLASGWQPNDFVLAPEAFADRKNLMIQGVQMLRRLWRGEKLPFRNPKGEMVPIGTLPRPVQREIPLWLTAAGNPETFQQAGELGCGVLTHLLGQSVEQVADKIRLYRQAWQKAGHAGKGHITLMLHTFVGESDDVVRETVRRPMKEYLRSSVDLIRLAAWSFPTFVDRAKAAGQSEGAPFDIKSLSAEEMGAILDYAFERYYTTSALFGTVDRCREMVARLAGIGVDEIACLIDFGVPSEQVLQSLPMLKQLMDAAADGLETGYRASVADDVAAHRITHLQCTPSMASMLVADASGRAALASLDVLMVGGEALPVALAKDLRALVPGKLLNMYGPTETTIWSSTCELREVGDFVPLGEPIANTSLHVLDAHGRECPALVVGELHIGGAGVARGYLNRPELTAERFIRDPFAAEPSARLYRTGDLVRRHRDGALEFLGRIDNQVKIRGHRIELGEIEAILAAQPGVKEAVATAREHGGSQQLLAYVTTRDGVALDGDALRRAVSSVLPEIMVPSRVMVLPKLPLTPNGKIDRAALPSPEAAQVRMFAAPEGETEALIANIWCELLGLPSVSRTANFFDLGGHSLMVIQAQRRLQAATGHEIAIVDMFRNPTIRALAAQIDGKSNGGSAVDRGVDRARARRALLQRRA